MKEATKRVVQRLKEVKIQKNLTCQDIVDACDYNNEPVSLSTVRRIFANGSEDGQDYRPYTINAIFRAVIGTDDVLVGEDELTEPEKEVLAENAALKAVVELRDTTIAELQAQIETLRLELEYQKSVTENFKIKCSTTIEMFQIAMESLGRSSSQPKL